MKYNFRQLLKILLIFVVIGTVLPCITMAAEIKSVLIISLDALHPDALHPDALVINRTKTIHSLMKKGVFTLDGKSTDPPLTLLSHAAMFSGLGPNNGGQKENRWKPGQKQIAQSTIFDDAKLQHFSTGFFYSKEKLGYLISDGVDHYQLDPEFSVDNAMEFFEKSGSKKFCFLHISGLDRIGPIEGWMSDGYMEELSYIDESINPLIAIVMSNKAYLIIVTSDHAGHKTIHGSEHPDDSKLPLVMISDIADLTKYQAIRYDVIQLRHMLKTILNSQQ